MPCLVQHHQCICCRRLGPGPAVSSMGSMGSMHACNVPCVRLCVWENACACVPPYHSYSSSRNLPDPLLPFCTFACCSFYNVLSLSNNNQDNPQPTYIHASPLRRTTYTASHPLPCRPHTLSSINISSLRSAHMTGNFRKWPQICR